MKKIRVGVVFGGRSAEHEVSLLSAKNVIEAMDKDKYEITLIGIDKNGEWHVRDKDQFLLNGHCPKQVRLHGSQGEFAFLHKESDKQLVQLSNPHVSHALDVIFPILHGTYGEDGTVQGLLKLANIPFVGAGVLGSAIGMDKDVMKRLLRDGGIPIAKFLTFHQTHHIDFEAVKKELGLPLFVKPANLGSSVGVSKVKDKADFERAVAEAFLYDRKILIEEFIKGREIECSILGNEHPIASLPGEIVSKDEFYSYDAKYVSDSDTTFYFPAHISEAETTRVQELSIKTYQALCCEGLARIDLFLKENGDVVVNEINTLPGCTPLSAFPKLWEVSGLPFPKLIDCLIELALERFEKEKLIKTTF